MKLAETVYLQSKKFPKEELYGITSQIRRAAVSIPSNIAEGCARNTYKENIQFLGIAAGSLAELDTQLRLAMQLEFLDKQNFAALETAMDEVGRMLSGLKKSLRNPA